jgi:hypothetical protein
MSEMLLLASKIVRDLSVIEFSKYKGWVFFLKPPSRLKKSSVFTYICKQLFNSGTVQKTSETDKHTQSHFTNDSAYLISPFVINYWGGVITILVLPEKHQTDRQT